MNKKLAHVPGGKKIIKKEGERRKNRKNERQFSIECLQLDLQLSFLYLAREHVKVFMKMALSAFILVVNLYMGFFDSQYSLLGCA